MEHPSIILWVISFIDCTMDFVDTNFGQNKENLRGKFHDQSRQKFYLLLIIRTVGG